jgi:hypothetical protein
MWLLLSCNNCSKVQEQVQTGRDVGRRCDGSNETLPAIIGAGLVKTGKKKEKTVPHRQHSTSQTMIRVEL